MNELLRKLLYLPEQGSTFADEVDRLHYVVILITMLGAFTVFLTALWFTFRYRRRAEGELTPQVRAPPGVEVAVIVGLLSLFVAFWIVGFQQYMRLRLPPDDAMPIYVTAKKWMWKFAYPDGERSNGVLVVPSGRPIKLIMTSRDVIHSFYVPAFRQKQDVLPGRYTATWFEVTAPGVYRTFCAEYCGTEHSRMWADVVALDPADYEAWRAGDEPPDLVAAALGGPARRGTLDTVAVEEAPRGISEDDVSQTMAERGLQVAANKGCLSCHTVDGQDHVGPSFRGLYGRQERLEDGSTVFVDEAYLTRSMMEPMAEIAAGYRPLMPTYLGQLQPAEIGALIELIRSLRWPLPELPRTNYPGLPTSPAPPPEAEDRRRPEAP